MTKLAENPFIRDLYDNGLWKDGVNFEARVRTTIEDIENSGNESEAAVTALPLLKAMYAVFERVSAPGAFRPLSDLVGPRVRRQAILDQFAETDEERDALNAQIEEFALAVQVATRSAMPVSTPFMDLVRNAVANMPEVAEGTVATVASTYLVVRIPEPRHVGPVRKALHELNDSHDMRMADIPYRVGNRFVPVGSVSQIADIFEGDLAMAKKTAASRKTDCA